MVETQVGTDKQVLSTHFLTFITPLVVMLSENCHAVKAKGDTPNYFRTAKRAKRSRKFNAGVLKKKWAGH